MKSSPFGAPVAVRAFESALRLLPAGERARHGAAMIEVFEALHRDAVAERGWWGGLTTLLAELPGLLRYAAASRLAERAAERAALAAITTPRDENMLDSFRQDLRFTLRSLVRTPGFTAVAVATLALGIGANTAVFSVVNGVLLEPLAYSHPSELVAIGEGQVDGPLTALSSTSPGSFYDWQRQATTFRGLAAYTTGQATLTGRAEPQRLNGVSTVGDLFQVLGVRPSLGRTPSAADEVADQHVLVLSDAAWRRYFDADLKVVGSVITLDGTQRMVIGVMPPSFHFPDGSADFWTPASFSAAFKTNRDQYMLEVVGRLAPGVTLERARSDMATISSRMRRDWPQYNSRLRIDVVPLKETIVGNVRDRLGILMGAVLCVMLIACANLGNLLLARSVTRRREIAIRQALGAARTRIVRQLLTESLVLSGAGAIAGAGIGFAFLRLMLAQQSIALPRIEEIALDGRVLAFTLALAIVAGLAFGLVPALQLARGRSAAAMREGARGSAGHGWVRDTLVVVEFALAMMLLAGAGLLLNSFARLTSVDPGLRVERLLTFALTAPRGDPTFVTRSLERLRAIPGVTAASVISGIPVTSRGIGAWLNIVDRPTAPNITPPGEAYRVVSPDFFATAGVPIRRGSLFTGTERADHAPALVVNEALARRYWPGENPIGKQIWLGAPGNAITPPSTIVGVVGNTMDGGMGAPPIPIVYIPAAMVPSWRYFGYLVRTAVEPAGVARAVRQEIRAIDPTLAITGMSSMEERVSNAIAPARWSMTLLGVFAGIALVLAAIGIFGVLSFLVTQRTRELGIRIALGASPERVRRMVVVRGLGLAVGGAAIGACGALALRRLMDGMLFSVSSSDPLTYASVTGVLVAVAVAASYTPARRATRVDPIVALRHE